MIQINICIRIGEFIFVCILAFTSLALFTKYVASFETQYPSRAAPHAFAARQAAAIADRNALPGMAADIDPGRAIKHTDPALHAAARLRHHLPLDNNLPARGCYSQ